MNNFMQKGKAWLVAHKSLAIFIAFVLIVGVILAIVLPLTVGNIFRASKVAKINLGDDYAQVVKILGKPNELTSGDTEYNYYSKNITKKMEQLAKLEDDLENLETWDDVEKLYEKAQKLESEIAAMEYKYITVSFSNGKVSRVQMDCKAQGVASFELKTVKKQTVGTKKNVVYLIDLANNRVPLRTYYGDGSYALNPLPSNAVTTNPKYYHGEFPVSATIVWEDSLGEYSLDATFDDTDFNFWWSLDSVSGWNHVVSFGGDSIPSMSFYRFFEQDNYPWYDEISQSMSFHGNYYYVSEIKLNEAVLRLPSVESLLPEESLNRLENITVDENNPQYASLYGILFNKALTELIYVPAKNENLVRALLASNILSDGPVYINNVLTGYKGEMPENYELEIRAGTVGIAENALENCENLTSVTIPNSVQTIGNSAFANCTNLTQVSIGSGVSHIGSRAFASCVNLEEVSVSSSNSTYLYEGNCLIEIQTGKLVIGLNNAVIPTDGSVKEIARYAFSGSSVTEIVVPTSVTSIELGAFEDCNLEVISLPFIGGKANEYNGYLGYIFGADNYSNSNDFIPSSLKSVTISGDLTTRLYRRAFSGCGSLENIVICDSVRYIEQSTFADCVNLVSLTVPFVGYSRTDTKDNYFGYLFGASKDTENSTYVPQTLKTVVITDATSIASDAFRGCDNLTCISIPKSVQSIGRYAFSGCSKLESLTLPFVGASRTEIQFTFFGYVFGGTNSSSGVPNSLTEVAITDTTTIPDSAFRSCSKIVSITLPDNLESIGVRAFEYCSKLASIIIPANVNYIGQYAFSSCSVLRSATFENPSGWW